jgi:hypothetical protein
VNTVEVHGKPVLILSNILLAKIRESVAAIGEDFIGLKAEDVSSWAAMVVYLNNIPVYTIMLIGRQSSKFFLRYIHQQVTEFSIGVSSTMITCPYFFYVPQGISPEDPCMMNHKNNFSARNTCGLSSQLRNNVQHAFTLN